MRGEVGRGSVYEMGGFWWASISLRDARKIRRRCRSEEEARDRLPELIAKHRDELGYQYHARLAAIRRPDLVRVRPPRSGVTERVRFDVFQRDGFRCVYCGATATEAKLVVDHVLPVADGGSDEIANLATACWDCNAGKGGRPLLSKVDPTLGSGPSNGGPK